MKNKMIVFGIMLSLGAMGWVPSSAVGQAGGGGRYGTIIVRVPDDAIVTIGGQKTKQTGPSRTFYTQDLEPGFKYQYEFTVTSKKGTLSKWVDVTAGATVTVDLTDVKKDPSSKEGFTALFNGKDLTNWQGLVPIKNRAKMSKEEYESAVKKATAQAEQHWMAKEGILYFDGKGQSLQTAKDYGDFELFVDWKIGPGGDSGVYLRGNPQVQIWDNKVGSGGLFNNQKNPKDPLTFADKPVGEWNTFHIVMKGDRVTIKLNDVLVVDNTPLENYWDRGKPLPETGPIELQNHGNPLYFKNIHVRELK